jgi:hypothetical protein
MVQVKSAAHVVSSPCMGVAEGVGADVLLVGGLWLRARDRCGEGSGSIWHRVYEGHKV